MTTTMELARFTVDPADVPARLAARPALLETLQQTFPGFVSLRLLRLDDRTWLDLAEWRTRADAEHAASTVMDLPACAAVFAFIQEMVSMEHAEVVPVASAVADTVDGLAGARP